MNFEYPVDDGTRMTLNSIKPRLIAVYIATACRSILEKEMRVKLALFIIFGA